MGTRFSLELGKVKGVRKGAPTAVTPLSLQVSSQAATYPNTPVMGYGNNLASSLCRSYRPIPAIGLTGDSSVLLYIGLLIQAVMIAQWDSSLFVCPGSIPSHGGVFQGIFPWLIALCQPVLSQCGRKWLNLPSKTPHNLWTARRKAEVQPRTDDGW